MKPLDLVTRSRELLEGDQQGPWSNLAMRAYALSTFARWSEAAEVLNLIAKESSDSRWHGLSEDVRAEDGACRPPTGPGDA